MIKIVSALTLLISLSVMAGPDFSAAHRIFGSGAISSFSKSLNLNNYKFKSLTPNDHPLGSQWTLVLEHIEEDEVKRDGACRAYSFYLHDDGKNITMKEAPIPSGPAGCSHRPRP